MMEMRTRKRTPALGAIAMVIWKVSKIAMSQTMFDGSKTAMGTRTMSLTPSVLKVSQDCVLTWSFFEYVSSKSICQPQPDVQMIRDSHARLAERCIPIPLHPTQTRSDSFPKFPIEENQPPTREDGFSKLYGLQSRGRNGSEGSVGKRPDLRLVDVRLPTDTKVHRTRLNRDFGGTGYFVEMG